jgi:hypothetical protein
VAIIPIKDLAKFGYKSNMKLKKFNHPSMFWLHIENQV